MRRNLSFPKAFRKRYSQAIGSLVVISRIGGFPKRLVFGMSDPNEAIRLGCRLSCPKNEPMLQYQPRVSFGSSVTRLALLGTQGRLIYESSHQEIDN